MEVGKKRSRRRWRQDRYTLGIRDSARERFLVSSIATSTTAAGEEAGGGGAAAEEPPSDVFRVLAIAAANCRFWHRLQDIKYVAMLTCVCKETRAMLQPTRTELPYWGVWGKWLRGHQWNEFNVMLNVKRNDIKSITEFERADPLCARSPRVYNLYDVMEFMIRERYGGSKEAYAAAIVRYRRNRITHIRRQISFAARNVEGPESALPDELQERRRVLLGMQARIEGELREIDAQLFLVHTPGENLR